MQISSSTPVPPSSAAQASPSRVERHIVSVHDEARREALKAELLKSDPSARVTQDLPIIDAFAVETSVESAARLRRLALAGSDVKVYDDACYVVPEGPQAGAAPHLGLDSATSTLDLDTMWSRGFTGKGIGIAVIDTGVAAHRDLRDRIIAYKDVTGGGDTPKDSIGHGTHVAGIAAGAGIERARYKGCAPEADVIGIQVFDRNSETSASKIIAGIQWAIENKDKYHIRVFNLSLGAPIDAPAKDDPVVKAVEAAVTAGIVPVIAAGNNGPDPGSIMSPAHSPNAIAVGAFNDHHTIDRSDDRMAQFSSRGPTDYDGFTKPDVIAPGVDITAAKKTSGYITYSGTSMASPMVAGCVALLLQACPNLTPLQVRDLLMRTARPLPGYDANTQGAGVIDTFAAMKAAQTAPPFGSAAPASAPTAAAESLEQPLPPRPAYVPDQVIVKFAPGFAPHSVASMAFTQGLTMVRRFDVPPQLVKTLGGELYQFTVAGGRDSVEQAVERLSGQPGVLYAEPNYIIGADDTHLRGPATTLGNDASTAPRPNDLRPDQWDMDNRGQQGGKPGADIGATRAWAIETGKPNGQGPIIAIIDSGVDPNHPDLAANMWTNPGEIPGNGIDDDRNGYVDDVHGINAQRHTGNPMDDNGHGTHCAGVIGAVTNNREGIAGLNWTATMAGIKMSNEFGSADAASAIASILYATAIGARITSNSWGAGAFSQGLKDVMAASPALHICAAGNSAQDNDLYPTYPASYDLPNVVAVAAHNRNDEMPHFSNYGAHTVHVAAPGEAITSTLPNGGYGQMSGTSMATPHVAGVAGLIAAHFPGITNDQIIARLMGTAVQAPAYAGKTISGGRVDAGGALRDDRVAPERPRDLRPAQVGSNRVTLQWTATGDDGMLGRAFRYQVRVSDRPINDERDWNEAQLVASGAPGQAGSRESVTCLLPPESQAQPRWFAVRTVDGVGNPSPLAVTNVVMPATTVAFQDDFETDAPNWLTQGGWAKVNVPGRGRVFTDSPNGTYSADADTWIASRPIDLRSLRSPVLTFTERHDLEGARDFCRVEISDDGGRKWRQVVAYTGSESWTKRVVDLGGYEGKTVHVRFRLVSDGAFQKDGVYVDDVAISGDPARA